MTVASAPMQVLAPQTPQPATSSRQSPTTIISTADEAAARFASASTPAELLASADLSNPVVRAYVVARMSELEEARYDAVLAQADHLGIPIRLEGPGNKVSILHAFRGDAPLYRTTRNTNAAISSGANLIRQTAPYNLDGSGVKVGIWDGGSVRNTHQEFSTSRVVKKNSSVAVDDHATHVAGTIGANGTTGSAKGMAPLVAIDSYDWDSDYTEMTAAGAATAGDTTRIPISNHSYGYEAVTADMGRYEDECVTTDNLANSLPYYLIFWAAGNEQDYFTSKGGYQSITFNGLAKNILTVGAVEDAVNSGARDASNATMSYFSSWGPCDDGRIKPDVVANGVNLYSSIATGNTAYDTYSGTSMATPSAAGSASLLAQLYAREFSNQRMRSSMLKALLIHTADDLGTAGPDYQNGWGLINVKSASDLILAHKASLAAPKMLEGSLTNSAKTATHTFQWDGISPIRATLCWTEPAGTAQTGSDSRTPNLRHNLDLLLTAPNGTTTYCPFTMPYVGNWTDAAMSLAATTGKNNVDTVEQVLLSSPAQAGTYTVTVSLDGSLSTSSQAYSLIVTGGADVQTNPPPTVSLDAPLDGAVFTPGTAITLNATASDQALGGGAGSVQSVQFFNGTTSLGTDTTVPYSITWNSAAPGTHTLTAVATDTQGASATSNAATITVLSGDGTPAVSSFSPASGRAGDSVTVSGSNFAAVAHVRFNGAEAQFTVQSATSLLATVPAAATTGPISVETAYGNATSSSAFTVLQNPILISQVYGAGGNSGAIYKSDYVELYNRSDTTVNLTGWSVQYASASGTSWSTNTLTGSIAPGKYHLAKLAGGSTGSTLPTADSSGSSNMSGTSGKVALRDSTSAFTGSSPVGQSGLQDFVGYGTANSYEGSGAAPAASSTNALFRAGSGATDSGDNANDFTTGAPTPRNSSYGSATAPAITSATSASGTVGQSFSYQIAASNSPTSFNATSLPAGLTVNTSTGLISGTPTAVGTTNATISATNSVGTGNATLSITISAAGGGGSLIFSEDFASITSGNNVTTDGASSTWSGNTNFPTVSSAYQAGGCVKLGSSSATGSLTTRTIDLSAGTYTVSFKVKGWTTVEGNITVTPSGGSPQTVTYTQTMSGVFETKSVNFTGGTSNTTITIATTAKRAYIDDVVITASTPTPLITATGTLASVGSTYGSASPTPTTFTVSGANMTAPILVSAPAEFELSQTSGGASGYAPSQTVGAPGTIATTTLYLRLAATTPADSYAGDLTCTSAGAATVNLAIPASTVRPRLLTITASDRTKTHGQSLSLGTSDFTTNGLAGAETIGSATLIASGGTASDDPVGTYAITPSNATGGTFSAFNYDITYQQGTLTVTPATYSQWTANHPTLGSSGAADDFEGDGLPNLVEFYLGLDPTLPTPSPLITEMTGGSAISLTYSRSKSADGVTGTVETSPTLGSGAAWTSVPPADDLFVSETVTHETRRATATIPSGETKIFLRLRVNMP